MATTTATATVGCLQQQQQQRPLRGISIIIEAEQAAQPGGSSSNSGSNSNSAVAVAGDEMSLKSQISMLLAFGDNSNSNNSNNSNDNDDDDHNCNNLETLHDDHATKVNLETSYTETTTAATTATATTAATRATKLYPQLLLRIGQSEAEVEAEAAAGVAAGAEEMASATAAAAATIISCNIADDVSNVLRAAAAAGETEERQAAEQQQSDEASQLMLVDWTTTTSAVTEQQQLESPLQHTVKIQIANGQGQFQGQLPGQGRGLDSFSVQGQQPRLGKQISVVKLNDSQSDCDMVLQLKEHQQQQQPMTSPYQLCYLVSSGQYSPCETLDSGTGSDLESMKSPDSNSNSNNNVGSNSSAPKLELHLKTTRIRVNSSSTSGPGVGVGVGVGVGSVQQSRAYSLTDSEECDESSSSLSCDSLHSNEAAPTHKLGAQLLPSSLLRDLRQPRNASEERQLTLTAPETATGRKIDGRPLQYEADQYYNFHVNEHANYPSFGEIDSCAEYATHGLLLHSGDGAGGAQPSADADAAEEDAFVGYRDVRRNPTKQVSTIRSSKGTVRGVKNRVRNGVATFLQLQQPNVKVSQRDTVQIPCR